MRSDGLALKQSVMGRVFNPNDPNQVKIVTYCILKTNFKLFIIQVISSHSVLATCAFQSPYVGKNT